MLNLVSLFSFREVYWHTERAQAENEEEGEDVNPRVVGTMTACRAAGRLRRGILPALEFCLEDVER